MDMLLKVEDLSVGYKTYRGLSRVLDDINIEMRDGEKIGVIGESGCGKTTLLKTILGILPPNAVVYQGKVIFKGTDLLNAKSDVLSNVRRNSIGMIFQDPMSALNPFFKVRDQLYDAIKYSPLYGGGGGESSLKDISLQLLREVALPDPERVLDSYPFQLSGGMRQRICIALALTRAHDLLLADEPTTNLDVTIQEQILELLGELVNKRNLSVILVTHALGMVKEFTDRIYVMYAGQIVETTETQTLFTDPQHPYTRFLLESVPKITGKWESEGLAGRIPDYVNPPRGCRFSPRCPFATDKCREAKPPLIESSKGHFVRCWLYQEV